ncbi:hypothetical protein D3C84_727000 [compost metagenome]
MNGLQQFAFLLEGPDPGASAGNAVLDQHADLLLRLGEMTAQGVDIAGGVHQAAEAECRVLLEAGDDRHIGLADELVGHQETADAMGISRLHLGRRRQGDAPGAMRQLQMEQGRAHGGLAMGGELYAIALDELAHPFQVVLDAALAQHRHGQADLFVQNPPAQAADIVQPAVIRCRSQTFGKQVQRLFLKFIFSHWGSLPEFLKMSTTDGRMLASWPHAAFRCERSWREVAVWSGGRAAGSAMSWGFPA